MSEKILELLDRFPRNMTGLREKLQLGQEKSSGHLKNAQAYWNSLNEYSEAFQGLKIRLALLLGVKRRRSSKKAFVHIFILI